MTLRKLPPRKVRDPAEFESFVPKPRAPAAGSAELSAALASIAALDLPQAQAERIAAPIMRGHPKPTRHESEPWRRAVASLPCVLCGRHGRTQCAHRNEGKGMSIKTDDALTAALCDVCHTDIDQGSQHTKAARRARMDRAILLTLAELARRGLVKAVAP
jgi:hypothetical protein